MLGSLTFHDHLASGRVGMGGPAESGDPEGSAPIHGIAHRDAKTSGVNRNADGGAEVMSA
ncbi:hypothetical protein GCM10010390_63960 [Streptomyces mordarskii]|uniref:Uncharacterized protein n=1 Tax=Streptomyces mordarskii TaxID=1226758 RepID=A0ABN1DVR5_9ACTN